MVPGIVQWFKDQFEDLPQAKENLEGRVIIVTGSNTGLGFECAKHFLQMRPLKLILAVRSLEKGRAAALRMLEDTKETNPDVVEVWKVDMASFESVNAFAKRTETLPRLDIVCLNSGISAATWRMTHDGYETSLQVNVISTGLLAMLLLPAMQRTATLPSPSPGTTLKPHLVIVASDAHYLAIFREHETPKPITALNDPSKSSKLDRYAATKLLDIFIARKISKLLSASEIIVSAVNPAMCHSELTREFNFIVQAIARVFMKMLARTSEMGARNYTWAALKEFPSGSYINSCRVDPVSKFANSSAGLDAEQRVWSELVDIWIQIAPQVAQLVKP